MGEWLPLVSVFRAKRGPAETDKAAPAGGRLGRFCVDPHRG